MDKQIKEILSSKSVLCLSLCLSLYLYISSEKEKDSWWKHENPGGQEQIYESKKQNKNKNETKNQPISRMANEYKE